MSYFDDWLETYFSPEEAGKFGSIGCHSFTSSRKKSPRQIRESLADLEVSSETIDRFIEGLFNINLSLSFVIQHLREAEKTLKRLLKRPDDQIDAKSVAEIFPKLGKRLTELEELEAELNAKLERIKNW